MTTPTLTFPSSSDMLPGDVTGDVNAALGGAAGELLVPGARRHRGTTTGWSALVAVAERARHRLPDATAVALGLLLLALAAGSIDPVMAVAVAVSWPVVLDLTGRRRLRNVPGTARLQARSVVRAGAVYGLGCWVLQALLGSRVESLLGHPVQPALLVALTATLTAVSAVGALTERIPPRPQRVLVAGSAAQVAATLDELARAPHTFAPVAVCSLDPQPLDPAGLTPHQAEGLAGLPVQHGWSSITDLARTSAADAVLVVPGTGADPREVQRLGWALEPSGTQLFLGTGLLDTDPARTALTRVAGLRLLHVRSLPERGLVRVAKDLGERALATLALLAMLPVLVGLAVAVRRDSTGPALFRQVRVGRNGREFVMLKYRTMSTTAEREKSSLSDRDEGSGVLFKMRCDPRVTRVGAVLRRYSLDELPQLINVVRGDMSLVGPRPALPQEVAQYEHDPRRRLAVKPGLTGLWQVSGRSDLSWEESVRLDLAYVDNWSLRLDARIVARTVGAVLSHRGAY
ncbi:sugar transferase [Nocardioides sambongensis]|uniref:sugar transferase n=1 Tax=Nocardioides sambongensis TaxID=2589074 RepID=UPI0018C87743|nr:sugar transferase [Nocardioides sambongensis]